ncbi:MAG TPA: Maf family protein [Miltoncostaeaceae bacterium]|nr:Maf family protein [Miltoncostaeaceae bacterium]
MIVLASRSPQRRGILTALGVPHRVVVSRHAEDDVPGLEPGEQALLHARAKAEEVAARSGVPAGGAVLGADTMVVADGGVFGKPAGEAEAKAMLRALGGRAHEVVTAVHLIGAAGRREAVDRATVVFRPLSEAVLAWYLGRGEWQGRAGGYAIQGSGGALVARVEGDFTTVVGLPVAALVGLLEDLGIAPWSDGP